VTEPTRPAPVRLDRWTVTSGSNVNSRAAVVVRGAGHDWKASAEGNGPVDALYRAVDRALAEVLDGGHPQLLSYDVHALAEGPSAEGRVTVVIAPPATSPEGRTGGRFAGEAASTNTVAASVEAYLVALNAMLASEAWTGATEVAAEAAAARRAQRRGTESAPSATEFDDDASAIDTVEWFNR
jgi:LeuA allosteric (dimerisation) domain